MSIKLTNKNEIINLINQHDGEYVIINNPEYIFPEREFYRLADRNLNPLKMLDAVLMDMDGTTTTTEELCIHSLEYMVRVISGLESHLIWPGLDRTEDYPHIIGNSTTKHVEYLIQKYHKGIKSDNLSKAYIFAALWTLIYSQDLNRVNEVKVNLKKFLPVKDSAVFASIIPDKSNASKKGFAELLKSAAKKFYGKLHIHGKDDIVRASIDIYYQRYHEILHRIKKGESEKLQKELGLATGKSLIEPMQGTPVFLALVKGLLGNEADKLTDELISDYIRKDKSFLPPSSTAGIWQKLRRLGLYFEKHPVKVAVVTSSIMYEAEIVLSQLFEEIRNVIAEWKINAARKKRILERFSSPHNFYDAIITATDSSEIRLKPHRDLYSIALYKLGVPKSSFRNVIGFEDSESGTIAIRAAGVGKSIAVPFAHTQGHNLAAATLIAEGGLPEIIIKNNIFIKL
ncbi:MAG: HAD family phosphatase [Ignavibacteriaceae bacterium]|nr:HAD family phosphatase [Ignavibacteriaceae bacterium]